MLLEENLAAWLASRDITVSVSFDSLPDREPNRAVALSVSGGLGLSVEQAFDRPTVSVLTRGANGKDARDLALQIDRAILDAEPGFLVGDSWVVDKGRFGGPPSYVATDDRRRVLRSATYYFEIER